ncbi:unnamed protein product, partial [Phaeothamnion confervicola]
MNDFDDPRLRQQLGRLSGAFPDENVALVAVRGKARRARRRRAAILSGGTAVGALVLGVAAFAAQPESAPVLRPSSTSATGTTDLVGLTPTSAPTTTTIAPTTTTVDESTTIPPTTTTEVTVTVAPTAPAVPEQPVGSGTGTGSGSGSGEHGSTPTTVPTTSVPVGPRTFSGQGGSITVRRQGDRVVVLSADPAGGFDAVIVDGGGRRVEVRFTSGDGHVTRIRVSLEDARLVPDVRESD